MQQLGRVLLTGAGGFVGRNLHRALATAGEDVIGWTRADLNLLDPNEVTGAIRKLQPDTIFHLAAAGVSGHEAHDVNVIAENVSMTSAILSAAPAGACILLTGSMSEYGYSGRLHELHHCSPRTAYGISKLSCGLYGAAYAAKRGQYVLNARLFGVYGPGEKPGRVFPSILNALTAGRELELSDGLQRRDFIHVSDVCDVLIGLARLRPHHPVVNVGTGKAVSLRDVALWIADAAGKPRELLKFGTRPRSPGDDDLMEADTSLLSQCLAHLPPQRLTPALTLDLFCSNRGFPVV